MARILISFSCCLLAGLGGCGEARPAIDAQRIDCAANVRALWEAEPIVQHRDGDELHQYWLLADRPDLWGTAAPTHERLGRYREQIREIVPDTSPIGLIRANRERNSWLDRRTPFLPALLLGVVRLPVPWGGALTRVTGFDGSVRRSK